MKVIKTSIQVEKEIDKIEEKRRQKIEKRDKMTWKEELKNR